MLLYKKLLLMTFGTSLVHTRGCKASQIELTQTEVKYSYAYCINCQVMKTYGVVKVQLHVILESSQDGIGWLASRFGLFPHRKQPRMIIEKKRLGRR